jgi:cytochrome c553
MKADLQHLGLVALFAAAAMAGCNRNEKAQAPAAAPAPSTAAASASAPAPAGPVIAPAAAQEPTDAQRTAGATIAAQGGGGAVAACNSCHGAQGEGNAAAGFPRIAGQTYAYLAHELESYANGSRKHPVMQPIASAMTPDQRTAAAAYFASLNPNGSAAAAAGGASGAGGATTASASDSAARATRAAGAGPAAGGRGAQLANVGDNNAAVQACANCHGPGGAGSGELYPYLAGQHASYITAALGAWRDGTRANDASGQMPLIAQGLTQQDIAALAAYYAAQPPRAMSIDAERMAAIGPAGAASGPAIASGPQTQVAGGEGGSPAAGTGTESGAPVTGGGQQGGGGTGTASTGAPQQGASAAR